MILTSVWYPIPEDFVAINALLNFLPEKIAREAILVSPYLVGDTGANAVFNISTSSRSETDFTAMYAV